MTKRKTHSKNFFNYHVHTTFTQNVPKASEDTLCPICRCEVVWPDDIAELIAQNKARYRKEKEEEELQALQELMSQFDLSFNIYDVELYFLILSAKLKYGEFTDDFLRFHRFVVAKTIERSPYELSDDEKSILTNGILKQLILECDEDISRKTKIIDDFITKNFSNISKTIFQIDINPLLAAEDLNTDDINLDEINRLLKIRNKMLIIFSPSNVKISIYVNDDCKISTELKIVI